MSKDDEDAPRYRVDEETRQLIEAAINMVSQTATLQLDDSAADGLVGLCDEIAHRFYIEAEVLDVVETGSSVTDETPTITVYRSRPPESRPKFRVIDGDLSDEPPTDDDTKH